MLRICVCHVSITWAHPFFFSLSLSLSLFQISFCRKLMKAINSKLITSLEFDPRRYTGTTCKQKQQSKQSKHIFSTDVCTYIHASTRGISLKLVSYYAILCHITSYYVSYHITSYHIISYCIISCHVLLGTYDADGGLKITGSTRIRHYASIVSSVSLDCFWRNWEFLL